MLYKRGSKWWVRFTARGREIRVTSGTDRRDLAEEFEQRLREAVWREKALGQEVHTWAEACDRWLKEKAHKRSIKRDEQAIEALGLRERGDLEGGISGISGRTREMAVLTGLRSANIFRLKWEAVDSEQHYLRVRAEDAKGGRGIGIPLSQGARRILQQQRDKNTRVYVFADHKGRSPIKSIKTCWAKAVKRAGLEGLRFHDLRHTWAAWHTLSGTPPIILKELGGWSSLSMVERYSHLNPGHLSAWADNSKPYQSKPRKKK